MEQSINADASRYPLLYQLNTRVRLTALSRELGRPATLDDLPETELARLADLGFEWLWLLSVWQTGPAGRAVSCAHPEWRAEFARTLPDLTDEDIGGSGFAITGYTVSAALGGDAALARLRRRLQRYGLRLMLDFVPNHTALDHPWVKAHPDYYIAGSEHVLVREPQNYARSGPEFGNLVLAHGRDPNFPGWPDTFQLNYANPALQAAMTAELIKIAGQCDGVRCDMAMLVLPERFERTWGLQPADFWPGAIGRVRAQHGDFRFMAEVYWDLEWTLQQQGFDYTYDKRLYDRLGQGLARPIREHLCAGLEFQDKLARFLENHDEPRAAEHFTPEIHRAAAVLTFLTPGLRFFHQGQLEGSHKRISPHLVRGPEEAINTDIQKFYAQLLAVLRRPAVRKGQWRLLECTPAWEDNWSWDCFIAFAWQGGEGDELLLVVVNYAPHASQCYLKLPFAELADGPRRLQDLFSRKYYERPGEELRSRGLYLDVPGWSYEVFSVQ
jgi:hypothetical protein